MVTPGEKPSPKISIDRRTRSRVTWTIRQREEKGSGKFSVGIKLGGKEVRVEERPSRKNLSSSGPIEKTKSGSR